MRKIILGVLIGLGLSIGVTTYAADIVSLIGKKVDGSFPLYINDVRADKDVLVIDGTSYLPVRSAAALFGYDVSFNADLMVMLTKKGDPVITNTSNGPTASPTPTPKATSSATPSPTPTPAVTIAPIIDKAAIRDKIKIDIIGMSAQISAVNDEIIKKEILLKNIQNDANQAAKIQSTKSEITRLKALLADFTKQLDKLNKDLNANNK